MLSWTILLLTTLVASASATGVLLPLYVYPSAVYNDGAANWKPAFNAIAAHSDVSWLVVVNPGNGPGSTGKPGNNDVNYIAGVSRLNSYKNVKTIGYVRTDYAASPMKDLKANITTWSKWGNYADANLSIHGIFFDEASADYDYLKEAITFARNKFTKPITTICNFGAKASAKYYGICDVVVAFESYLNKADAPPYQSPATLVNNIPKGYISRAAVIVHNFVGKAKDGSTANAALLKKYLKVMSNRGLGWAYFASGGYESITTGPATVARIAADLAADA